MDYREKHCIINACVGGGWYPAGQKRLHDSLVYHGYSGDILTWNEEWPMEGYDPIAPHAIKAACFEKAMEMGYTTILWLDCSVWAVKQITPVLDCIATDGYYFWKSGYNGAQVCNDKTLEYFNVTRDRAEQMEDSSTSMFGINTGHPQGGEFIRRFIQSAKDGMFAGSRLYNPEESSDPRFMFSRFDQSCATILIGLLGIKMHGPVYSYIYEPVMPESVVLTMKGL